MVIKSNRKAYFDYEVLREYEAGLVLAGWEVKSIRSGNINLRGSYIVDRDGELWLRGATVGNYPYAPNQTAIAQERERKLLLRGEEIRKLQSEVKTSRRTTIVPLEIFLQNNLIKLKIAAVVSRRKYEKKERIKQRDMERQLKQDLKNVARW